MVQILLVAGEPILFANLIFKLGLCSGPDHPAGKGRRQIIEQKVVIIFVGIQTFENYLQTQSCRNFALWLPSSPNKRPPIKVEGPLKKADMISLLPNRIVRVDFMHVGQPLAATCTIKGKIIGHPIKTVTSTGSFFVVFDLSFSRKWPYAVGPTVRQH